MSGQLVWTQPIAMSTDISARWGHLGLASLGEMHWYGGTAADDALLPNEDHTL